MNYNRCRECGDYLDNNLDSFCSRQCELDAAYTAQCLCRTCAGTGRGKENIKGEWPSCRKCQGTGYTQ